MDKQRGYCYFLILVMVISIVTSVFVQHPNVSADANPPSVTINFAGNLSDSGGPYWRPSGESVQLAGAFSDGYYTNDSRQSEGWIYINLTVVDTDGVANVWLNWLNDTTWTNWTYKFINPSGNWWEINTSANFSTSSGNDYSFDVVANDTVPNTVTVQWNKTGIDGNYVRRYVQLNCTTVNITYTPYYFYNATYTTPNKYDRLHHDQGVDGSLYDTGYLLDDTPGSIVDNVYCSGYTGFSFDESVCIEPFNITNIYFHFWWSADNDALSIVGWQNYNRVNNIGTDTDHYTTNSAVNRSAIFYNNSLSSYSNNYFLETKIFNVTQANFTDNNIYETYVTFHSNGGAHFPSIISNRSFSSFILYNVPSNVTLNASYPDSDGDSLSDWNELYVTYTHPFLADTDNDGINDYWENHVGTDPNNYTDWNESTIPVVTTNATTGIGEQNATLHGYLNIDGNDTCRVGFQWGLTTSYGHTDFDLPLISGQNPPSDYSGNQSFQFPKDIWNYNTSVGTSGTCDNFFTQGGIYNNLDVAFRYVNGVLNSSYVPGAPHNSLENIDNSTDEPTYTYYITMDSADTLEFTYDNLTATTGDEFGHQIGIIGGLHLYGLTPGTTYHYRAFATNSNSTVYGSDMIFTTYHNWSINLNCFNASDGSPITDWDVFVTNQSGSETYVSLSNNNPHRINLSNGTCPTGTDIAFIFSKTNYTSMIYYLDISVTGNYTLNAYLSVANITHLYTLIVTDEYDQPIDDVKISIKKRINETLEYQNITVLYSDAVGSVQVNLTANIFYKVLLEKEGYATITENYRPDPIYYGIYYPKYFKLKYGEEVIEPLTPGDVLVFNGMLYANNTIKVNYYDKLDETINTNFQIYEVYNATRTFKAEYTGSTSNYFSFWRSVTNATRMHIVVLDLNHTTLGYVSNYTIHISPVKTDRIPGSWIEGRWAATFGDGWEFGYVNLVLLYIPSVIILVGLAAVGQPSAGVVIASLYLSGVTWYVILTNEQKILILVGLGLVLGFIAYIRRKGKKVIG